MHNINAAPCRTNKQGAERLVCFWGLKNHSNEHRGPKHKASNIISDSQNQEAANEPQAQHLSQAALVYHGKHFTNPSRMQKPL